MLIPSKLHHSLRSNQLVIRKRLLQLLNNGLKFPLILVHAPAGYGKTTLMSQWADEQKNSGWFSLDENDSDTVRFLNYFTAALEKATLQNLTISTQNRGLLAEMSELLVSINQQTPPFQLIIDDFHLIDNREIHEAIKYWIRHQPENMTLILVSRTLPPINIAKLRVNELLFEIDVRQLAFTHQESLRFFDSKIEQNLPEQMVHSLCEQVEGWPTALQLVNLYAKQHQTSLQEAIQAIHRIKSNEISEYLHDEVFINLTPETQHFLLCCSLLHSMNEYVVAKMTDSQSAHQQLDFLVKQGLFISPIDIDKKEQWWQFHPLFASFLRNHLLLSAPEKWQILHQKAANAWLEIGYTTEALDHAILCKDNNVLIQILNQIGWSLYHKGNLKLLENALNTICFEELLPHPNLILLSAWLLQSQHQHTSVSQLIDKFTALAQKNNIKLDEKLEAEFDALRAQVAINAGQDKLALTLATNALKFLPRDRYYARIVATAVIGEAHHCQGELHQALATMRQTEALAQQHHAYHHLLWSLIQQAEILLAQGFLQTAYDILDKANQIVTKKHLHKIPMQEFLLRFKGHILWEWHELDKAEAMSEAGIEMLPNQSEHLQCLSLLAKISLTKGDLDNGKRLLSKAESLIQQYTYHPDWSSHFYEVSLIYWQMTDNHSKVQSWLLQATKPKTQIIHFSHRQWRNIARANIIIGQYIDAELIVKDLIQTARTQQLISDLNRDLILMNRIYTLKNNPTKAQKCLLEALELSKQTNFVSAFVLEGELMAQQLRHILQLNILDELLTHKTQFILRSINQYYRHKFAHFDEHFVNRLLQNPQVPEILRISPLTQREWQVLGLIYSGYSNEQISTELQVALTTTKTHIRNIYQKIGVTNRAESIKYTQHLLQLMGYS